MSTAPVAFVVLSGPFPSAARSSAKRNPWLQFWPTRTRNRTPQNLPSCFPLSRAVFRSRRAQCEREKQTEPTERAEVQRCLLDSLVDVLGKAESVSIERLWCWTSAGVCGYPRCVAQRRPDEPAGAAHESPERIIDLWQGDSASPLQRAFLGALRFRDGEDNVVERWPGRRRGGNQPSQD